MPGSTTHRSWSPSQFPRTSVNISRREPLAGAGAAAIGTLVAGLLFEIRARDPLVIAAVVVLVGAVGLAACATAAKQGLRINPAAALRDE